MSIDSDSDTDAEPEPPDAVVAVAIPCRNEAAAVAAVVDAWRAALPEAEVIVFDNASDDGTGSLARALGVRVVAVPEPGKGNAVAAIFATLADRPAVVLVDGDGTYPAEAVQALLKPVLGGRAEMAVGARRPVAAPGAMTPVRGLGNRLIRGAFWLLIGPGAGDLLSGYRVFSPRFLRTVRPRSTGFEIEAELSSEAVARRFRIVEVPVPYHPRIAGTASKLRTVRDGLRIVRMIAAQGLRHRPWRALGLLALMVAGTGALGIGAGLAWPIVAVLAATASALATVDRARRAPPVAAAAPPSQAGGGPS